MPRARHALGAPPAVHGVRPHRLLRQLAGTARDRALPHEAQHPIIQSFEPGEDWYYCYVDELAFEADERGPSPSHGSTAAGGQLIRL